MSEPTVAPEWAPARRRLLTVVGGLALVAAVAVLAVVVFKKPSQPKPLPQEYYDERLRDAAAEVDRTDPRWHFDELEKDRAPAPTAEDNAALVVMACVKLLPEERNPLDTAGLRAELRSDEARDQSLKKFEPREQLKPAKAMLGEARKLADFSRGRHALDWNRTNPFATQLPHLVATNTVVDLLTLDAEVCAYEGRMDDALVSIRAALVAARAIGDEPMPLSQFKRIEWQYRGVLPALEETLRRGSGTEAKLLGVQQVLEAEAAEPILRMTARAERAGLHAMLTALEKDEVSQAELPALGQHGEGTALITTRRRDTLEAIHAWMLDYTTKFVALTQLPTEQQEARARELAATTPAAPPEAMPMWQALPVAAIVETCHKAQALQRCGATAMALERYRLAHGGWPDGLAALAPKYLKEVPADPFDGKPLRYLRARDGVVVYSVGSDGKEVAGADDLEGFAKRNTGGIAFRLWDAAARGKKK